MPEYKRGKLIKWGINEFHECSLVKLGEVDNDKDLFEVVGDASSFGEYGLYLGWKCSVKGYPEIVEDEDGRYILIYRKKS